MSLRLLNLLCVTAAVALTAIPGLAQSEKLAAPPPAPVVDGRFPRLSFVKISVADIKREADFFTKVFGLQPIERNAKSDLIAFASPTNDGSILILKHHADKKLVIGNDLEGIGFFTADIKDLFKRIVEHGGKITQEPKFVSVPMAGRPARDEYYGYAQSPGGHAIEAVQILNP